VRLTGKRFTFAAYHKSKICKYFFRICEQSSQPKEKVSAGEGFSQMLRIYGKYFCSFFAKKLFEPSYKYLIKKRSWGQRGLRGQSPLPVMQRRNVAVQGKGVHKSSIYDKYFCSFFAKKLFEPSYKYLIKKRSWNH
jgi:hypothetical protein